MDAQDTGTPSVEPATAGATGGPGPGTADDPDRDPQAVPGVVIRDNRRIDPTGRARGTAKPVPPAESAPVPGEPTGTTAGPRATTAGPETDPESPTGGGDAGAAFAAELAALRAEVDERTRDLQRVSAEYANYRKRMDRDKALVGEQAIGAVLTTLLPVLDDLDRAREHGDLVGPFGAVADQFAGTLVKFGLTPFGDRGDRFDPTVHEAVSHSTSVEVTESTCVEVLRRGYLLGERLLRPALVAVADPE